jgi:hypothetical protein
MNAADILQSKVNLYCILTQEYYAKFTKQGLSGTALENAIKTELQSPSDEDVKAATVKAEEWVYREKLDKANAHFQQLLMDAPFLQTIIPFFRTPVNITKWAYRRTPLLGLPGRNVHDIRQGGRAAREAVARQFSGMLICGGIVALYQAGVLVGPAPDRPEDRDRFYREGKQPWSIYLMGRYWSLASMEPLTSHLKIISSFIQAVDNYQAGKSKQLLGKSLAAVCNALMDQTYVMGINQFFEAINDPGRYGERFLTTYLQGMTLPTGLGYVARLTDPVIRQQKTFKGALFAKLPGLSRLARPQLSVYGQERLRPGWFARMQPWFIPARKEELDAVDRELQRLDFSPSYPGWGYSLRGDRARLSDAEYETLLRDAGPDVKAAMAQVMFQAKDQEGRPLWGIWDDDMKREALSTAVRAVRTKHMTRLKMSKLPKSP